MVNFILAVVSVVIFIILEPISFIYVVFIKKKFRLSRLNGYYRQFAVSIDRFGNHQYQSLFNATLIKNTSKFKFGEFNETVSSVLGRIELASEVELITYWTIKNPFNNNIKTFQYRKFIVTEYKPLGIFVNRFLNLLDKNHCIKSIHS